MIMSYLAEQINASLHALPLLARAPASHHYWSVTYEGGRSESGG